MLIADEFDIYDDEILEENSVNLNFSHNIDSDNRSVSEIISPRKQRAPLFGLERSNRNFW